MLCIIERKKWKDTIIELKQGRFPAKNKLDETEKALIKRIISNNSLEHPKTISEIIEVIDHQTKAQALLKTLGNL